MTIQYNKYYEYVQTIVYRTFQVNNADYFKLKTKEEKVKKIWDEIRLHVEKAAKIYGFTVSDEIFNSKKTGMPHKRIEKNID